MNLTITLNTEETGALTDLVEAYNRNREEPVSPQVYLQTVLLGIINDKVKTNFEAAASQLVAAAKSVPYEQRLELIALVQSKLS